MERSLTATTSPASWMLRVLVVAGCCAASCGDDDSIVATDGGSQDARVDASIDGATLDAISADAGDAGVVDGAIESPCPEEAPAAGASCTTAGVSCGYGDDPRPECRTRAACTEDVWTVTQPECAPLYDACPETREAALGSTCEEMDAVCGYDGLACRCTSCAGDAVPPCEGELSWHCDAPNTQPGCPAAPPNAGGGCAGEGTTCTYGCGAVRAFTCTDGLWLAADAPCASD